MHERFREGWRAAAYVGGGFMTDFSNAMVEVIFEKGGQLFRRQCKSREVGHVVEEYCKRFPKASVHYHEADENGLVAEVHCHCGHEKGPGCCRAGHQHRAKVLLRLLPTSVAEATSTGTATESAREPERH
jgi:hypothetical protein